jgi:multidrug efflux system outer membrane protein
MRQRRLTAEGTDVRRRIAVSVATAAALLSGSCAVGPDYKRPPVIIPEQHRFAQGPQHEESLADLPWWEITKDEKLQGLIREAIANNLDLRVATARVEEARARAGVAKSFYYPAIGLSGGYETGQVSRLSEPPPPTGDKKFHNWDASFSLSWELDIFGGIRRQNEAAYAGFLATEEGRRGVLITLVGDVASNYFGLLELDLELDIAHRTVESNDETAEYYRKRLSGGVSNRLEVDQAVANRSRTAATIPVIEREIALTENLLSFLLGRAPGPIDRNMRLSDEYLPPAVPAGMPASLLERRPDVGEAEEQLVASNADVGAAKALFFPSISLTGLLGVVSGPLHDLLKGDATTWTVGAGLFQPIFQGGRIKRNYEAAQARYVQAVAEYQKAALNGYREVADALVTIEKLGVQRAELESGVDALRDASALARARYDTGLSTYIEILYADQLLFDQELQLARVRGGEFRAIVELYRVLGGGWQTEPAAEETAK